MNNSIKQKTLVIAIKRKYGHFIKTFKAEDATQVSCMMHNIILTPEAKRLKKFQEVYQKSV